MYGTGLPPDGLWMQKRQRMTTPRKGASATDWIVRCVCPPPLSLERDDRRDHLVLPNDGGELNLGSPSLDAHFSVQSPFFHAIMPAILDGERELVTPLAVEQHTLYGIERALFGIRWADEIGEGERAREAIKSAQIRYSTTPIGIDWGRGSRFHMDENVP